VIVPVTRLKPSPRASARGSGMPAVASCSDQATEMAISATSERSMPRPMTTTSIPSPRMPSTATLRTSDSRLALDRKLLSVSAKAAKSSTVRMKTIFSWLIYRNSLCAFTGQFLPEGFGRPSTSRSLLLVAHT
jgi:hypothetical protein